MFECLVNAVACQQLTLTVGIQLLNRLAEAYGASRCDDEAHAFPLPRTLAAIAPESLRPLGFSGAKARSIVALAAAAESGALDPEAIEALDDEHALAVLLGLRGIGRWSGEYALLRGLGRLHVFPGDDVGARNNLARRLGRGGAARLRRRPGSGAAMAAVCRPGLLPPPARKPGRARNAQRSDAGAVTGHRGWLALDRLAYRPDHTYCSTEFFWALGGSLNRVLDRMGLPVDERGRLGLAARAHVRAAVGDADPLDRATARRTRQPLAAEDRARAR